MRNVNKKRKKRISDGIRSSSNKVKKENSVLVKTKKELPQKEKRKEIKKILPQKKIEQKIKLKDRQEKIFTRKKKQILKWFLFSFFYFFILFLIFNEINNTHIKIYPKTQKISSEGDIFLYKKPKYGQLALHFISLEESFSKKITANTKVYREKKASGKIRVFNNYSKEPQRLAPKTRFRSVSGKIFTLGNAGLIIPGKTEKGPGEVEAVVYAENFGDDYNIDVTDFTIPGFKESGLMDKYENIYALSLKKFSGGFKGEVMVIGEKEKKKIREMSEKKIKENLLAKLSREKIDRVLLVEDSIQIIFSESVITRENFSQKAKLFALIVKKEDLEKFLKRKHIKDFLKQELHLKDFSSIKLSYKSKKNINFSQLEKIKIHINYKNIFIWNINKDLIKKSLYGLKKDDIFILLKSLDEVRKAEIDIFPPWQKYISEDKNDIKVNVIELF